ncbi:MAG: alpha/beta hydrolase [Acidimicrobiaceae bacterium]|nr:alpha/beta hydrolase [Acidimicrobiaceae bacterium]MDE0318580.1 alpha/beta hydrolase [Acidimicrobiaceae bacterium]
MASDEFCRIRDIIAAQPIPASIEVRRAGMEAIAQPLPDGVVGEMLDANGVSCEMQTPDGARSDAIALYMHGGGYVAGSISSHRNLTGHLAKRLGCPVLSIDYRLAPEHPHPAPVEDSVAVYRWLLDRGSSADKIAIAGDSAGGGLAVSTLMKLRDLGLPLPAAAVSISPWVDMAGTGESMVTRADRDPMVTPDDLRRIAGLFLGADGDPADPYASPLEGDLSGLPPLLIHCGDDEVLLSDSERLAHKARASGVDVTLEVWPEMIHVWHFMAGFVAEADAGVARVAEYLGDRLGV